MVFGMGEIDESQNPDTTAITESSSKDISQKDDDFGEDTHIEMNSKEGTKGGQRDDVKDSKKALLEEDLKNQEDAIFINDHKENGSPLPSEKGESENQDGEVVTSSSIFISSTEKLKAKWQCPKFVEFILLVLLAIYGSVILVFLIGGIPIISTIELIIGAVYLHQCPADIKIPRYLIIRGFFETLIHVGLLIFRYHRLEFLHNHISWCIWMLATLKTFLFILFIAGSTWVYSIYEPDYVNTDSNDYCHKGMYLFSFWMFNLTFIVLFCMMAYGICYAVRVIFINPPAEKITVEK